MGRSCGACGVQCSVGGAGYDYEDMDGSRYGDRGEELAPLVRDMNPGFAGAANFKPTKGGHHHHTRNAALCMVIVSLVATGSFQMGRRPQAAGLGLGGTAAGQPQAKCKPGCMDKNAPNYDPEATVHDFECFYTFYKGAVDFSAERGETRKLGHVRVPLPMMQDLPRTALTLECWVRFSGFDDLAGCISGGSDDDDPSGDQPPSHTGFFLSQRCGKGGKPCQGKDCSDRACPPGEGTQLGFGLSTMGTLHAPTANKAMRAASHPLTKDGKATYVSTTTSAGPVSQDGRITWLMPKAGTPRVQIGDWVHWAGTYDSATNTMRLYIDGELVGQDDTSQSGEIIYPTWTYIQHMEAHRDGWFTIGAFHDHDEYRVMRAAVDEVRVWAVARSPSQIKARYCSAISGSEREGDWAGIILYFNFDERTGDTVVNKNPNFYAADARLYGDVARISTDPYKVAQCEASR